MQNKPYFFFLETGVPKRGGGGVRHLGKIPKKSRFFLDSVPKHYLIEKLLGPKSQVKIEAVTALIISNEKSHFLLQLTQQQTHP